MQTTRPCRSARPLASGALATLVLLLASGCAHIAAIDSQALASAPPGENIQVNGRHGPLSKRQARAVLAKLASEAPDADALRRHLAIEQAVAETPLYTGNSVRILRDGSQSFPAIFAAIGAARHYLLLEYYIFEDVNCNGKQLGDLLLERRQAGVQIRVIYDGVGSIDTPASFLDRLRAAGIDLVEYNPPNPLRGHFSINSRDHRKILVADGTLAILGGVNLSTSYESAPGRDDKETAPPPAQRKPEVWHDTDIEIHGPAVAAVESLFEDHWRRQGGKDLGPLDAPEGPAIDGEVVRIVGSSPQKGGSRYYVTALSAIRNAESSIRLTAAYFVPTHQELEGLVHAARRGVDVRLLLPSRSDSPAALVLQRTHYRALTRAGVRIWERTDGVLHSKTLVVDDVWSAIGSSNFDQRSVLYNDEVDAIVIGRGTAGQLGRNFESDLAQAQAIDPAHLPHNSLVARVKASFWHLLESFF